MPSAAVTKTTLALMPTVPQSSLASASAISMLNHRGFLYECLQLQRLKGFIANVDSADGAWHS